MVGTRGSNAQSASTSNKTSPASDKHSKRNAEDTKPSSTDNKDGSSIGQPLGPPPRPNQTNGERADYFSGGHAYQSEPNPFEAQFANPNDAPGKLPPVAALTSPSSLLPGDTPGWNSSLRSGPLSPAMLAGPASTDYFDQGLRGFPTPNESSLRTGLTPGGGGSMFPAASPGTQAIFSLSNINTPGTMDFLRSGMNARASANGNGPTSQPTEPQTTKSMDLRLPGQTSNAFETSGHDADAASSLFLLAQNGTRSNNSFPATTQSSSAAPNATTVAASETPTQTRAKRESIGSMSTPEMDDSDTDMSEEAVKPATRSRGRKAPETRPNNRRKATDSSVKTPASKRARTSTAQDKSDSSPTMESASKESKKAMTEDEKRKNFLERNRVAALKCRQRKKQWLSNLQQKVDLYGQENEALTNHVNQLREQIFSLRSLLVQHRECPTLTNHPAMMSILSQDMSGPQFMQTGSGPVQQMPMMIQDTRHVSNGGPVMPRN